MKNNQDLFLTLIQPDIFWEDTNRNLEHLDGIISSKNAYSDVILLPEMFSTGFTMNVSGLADVSNGKVLNWMSKKAVENDCAIAGSTIVHENGKFFNRFYWVNPDGEYFTYNKRHLFSMGNEDQFFTRGDERLIIEFKGWRICPLICYDLRFPVWSRNNNAYDLLIYVANWPAARNQVWNILLRARAIENQCFVAGINRVGRDGLNIHYIGESCLVHPKGYLTAGIHEPAEQILNCSISLAELNEFRNKFPVLKDRDIGNVFS